MNVNITLNDRWSPGPVSNFFVESQIPPPTPLSVTKNPDGNISEKAKCLGKHAKKSLPKGLQREVRAFRASRLLVLEKKTFLVVQLK